jgi:hypothetical protein
MRWGSSPNPTCPNLLASVSQLGRFHSPDLDLLALDSHKQPGRPATNRGRATHLQMRQSNGGPLDGPAKSVVSARH